MQATPRCFWVIPGTGPCWPPHLGALHQQCGSVVCQQCGQHTIVSPSSQQALLVSLCTHNCFYMGHSVLIVSRVLVWECLSRKLLGLPAACLDFWISCDYSLSGCGNQLKLIPTSEKEPPPYISSLSAASAAGLAVVPLFLLSL